MNYILFAFIVDSFVFLWQFNLQIKYLKLEIWSTHSPWKSSGWLLMYRCWKTECWSYHMLSTLAARYSQDMCPDIPDSPRCDSNVDLCSSHQDCADSESCCYNGCVLECMDLGKCTRALLLPMLVFYITLLLYTCISLHKQTDIVISWLSFCPCICSFICPSMHLSISLSNHPSTYPPIFAHVCLCITLQQMTHAFFGTFLKKNFEK